MTADGIRTPVRIVRNTQPNAKIFPSVFVSVGASLFFAPFFTKVSTSGSWSIRSRRMSRICFRIVSMGCTNKTTASSASPTTEALTLSTSRGFLSL